jgi:hypothetical protein
MINDFPEFNVYPDKTDNFQKILENLDQILENKVVDLTQGAIYFGSTGRLPTWLYMLVLENKAERTTQAGPYTFYRLTKA